MNTTFTACCMVKTTKYYYSREAVADNSILNIEHRIDWKNCKSTKEEEESATKAFRSKFTPFDFNED